MAEIARQLKLPGISWSEYVAVRDETRREHLLELYHHLNLKTFNNKIYQACVQHLVPLAARIDITSNASSSFSLSWSRKNTIRKIASNLLSFGVSEEDVAGSTGLTKDELAVLSS